MFQSPLLGFEHDSASVNEYSKSKLGAGVRQMRKAFSRTIKIINYYYYYYFFFVKKLFN